MTSMMLNGKGRIQNTWCNFHDEQSRAAALAPPLVPVLKQTGSSVPKPLPPTWSQQQVQEPLGRGTSVEVGRLGSRIPTAAILLFSLTEGPPTPSYLVLLRQLQPPPPTPQ